MRSSHSTAWLFPGQGSQFVGMGQALAGASTAAAEVFAAADAALGFPLSELCFHGPQAILDDTLNAQPALLTTSIAALRALEAAATRYGSPLPRPAFAAGHSLGEYSALVAAEALRFEDAVRLVRERGRLMKEAGEQRRGAMAALIGADDALAEAVAASVGDVQVANFNAPGQIVVSGAADSMARLPQVARERGIRRVISLAVSIAAHSHLMAPIQDEFRIAVAGAPLQAPKVPVIGNIHAAPLQTVDAIREELVQQLTAPVRWVATIEYMARHGVQSFIEIGPGSVLTGLVKRILKDVDARSIGSPEDIQTGLGQGEA